MLTVDSWDNYLHRITDLFENEIPK